MKKTLLIMLLLLVSSMTMAQLSPGAEGIRQKLAEYARSEGMITNYEGDALTIRRDTLDYAVIFGGVNPVYIEIRLFDLDISDKNPECIAKTANYINLNRSAVKASLVPYNQSLRLSVESFVNDAQSVINSLKHNMDLLRDAWLISRKKYDEFVDNQQFANLRIPFEVYSAEIANQDKDDNLITEFGADIKSEESQYITTSLAIAVYEEGDYTIGVKFIMPDGSVSKVDDGSPYTFTNTLSMRQQQSSYFTGGWGSPNPGTWNPGNYRIEFYYKDKPFYIKRFEIK